MFINSGADGGLDPAGSTAWGARCLNVTRIMAIAAVALVPASTAAASTAVALMFIAWAASGRVDETLRAAGAQRVGQVLLIFLVLLVVDTLYSSATWAECRTALWAWRKPVLGLIALGLFAAEVWKLRLLFTFLAVSAVGLIASYAGWLELIPSKTGHAPGVFFTNHATQGMTFAVAVLCCLELGRHSGPRLRRLLHLAAVLFAANIVFTSISRSAYVALICVVLAWGLSRLGWRRLPLVAGMLALVVAIAVDVSPTLRDRINQGVDEVRHYRISAEETSAGARMVFWKNALALASERPWLGYGTGSYAREYNARFENPALGWRGAPAADPHNQYLLITVENGLLGLAVFIAVLTTVFIATRGTTVYQGVARGALLAWCVTSLFNSHFRTFPEGHLIWLLVGAMLAGMGRNAPVAPGYALPR